MSDKKQWRTWDEIEAEAKADGRLDEAQVAAERERMRAEQRAYQALLRADAAAVIDDDIDDDDDADGGHRRQLSATWQTGR